MIDWAQTFLDINTMLKDYHEAMLRHQSYAAYELSEKITDLAQQLEDMTKNVES